MPILALVALVLRWQSRKSFSLATAVSEQNLRLGDQISEVLGGILRIKMRGQEAKAEELLSTTAERIFRGCSTWSACAWRWRFPPTR